MLPSNHRSPSGNHLLDLLSVEEFERLEPSLQKVTLALKDVVHAFDVEVSHVHFPTTAMLSLLAVLEDDDPTEVAIVGRGGMAGVTVALGVPRSPHRVICQMPGESLRLPSSRFLAALEDRSGLSRLVKRYTSYMIREASQAIACNTVHPLEGRAGRWLLMVQDQAGEDQFPMTQEFMAYMLGVRRQTVTVVMGAFQGAGLIAVRRGNVTVRDRAGLEEASCECYAAMKLHYDRVVS